MKFTNGYWHMREGIKAYFPDALDDAIIANDCLTVYAPTKKQNTRGDTLNIPLLTVRFSSPMPDVIRVQMIHHKGVRTRLPKFEIQEVNEPSVEISRSSEVVSLKSGKLSVRIPTNAPWKVDYWADDHLVTASESKGMGIIEGDQGNYIHEQLSLGVGEYVYGLGERFTAFMKNGQVVDIWNEDGGTSSEQTYKNIPFYLTNRGYGVFVNHPEKVSFEVASEKVERVHFSVPGQSLEYFVIYGPTPKEVLEKYTALTGRPALPPPWSFGLWLTTSFLTQYDEKTVTSFIQGMADRDIPLHVFHFDCFWMKGFQWCDFRWDTDCFPDPQAMLMRLKTRGLKICVWINPYIAQKSYLFDEGMENGYLLKRTNGDVWQWDMWQAGMGLVDFTNPAACAWFAGKLSDLIDMGVDCFKTDFGERIPVDDVVYFNGADPVKMHNYYTFLYNQCVFELLEKKLGIGEAAVFARSATAGGQRFPVHWGGDSTATFESMAETLRGGLSLSACGFGFWSHDMGGFEFTASADVYKRWCAFGLLSSHSRLHGSSSYRVPWLYDDEAVDVLRFFTKMKCTLMPYIYQMGVLAHEKGIPVLRAMPLEFPDDPACETLDRQYMLGDSILVAPVFTSEGKVDYYLPDGEWTHFISNKVILGGRWQRERYDFLSLPLFIRENTILAVGANDQRPDYSYCEGVTFHFFALKEGNVCTAVVPDTNGQKAMTVSAQLCDGVISINVDHIPGAWQIILRNIPRIASVEGGAAYSDVLGTRIIPAEGSAALKIYLA